MNNGNQDESFARSLSEKKSLYFFEKNYSHIIDKGLSCFEQKVVPHRNSQENEALGKDNEVSQVGNYDQDSEFYRAQLDTLRSLLIKYEKKIKDANEKQYKCRLSTLKPTYYNRFLHGEDIWFDTKGYLDQPVHRYERIEGELFSLLAIAVFFTVT